MGPTLAVTKVGAFYANLWRMVDWPENRKPASLPLPTPSSRDVACFLPVLPCICMMGMLKLLWVSRERVVENRLVANECIPGSSGLAFPALGDELTSLRRGGRYVLCWLIPCSAEVRCGFWTKLAHDAQRRLICSPQAGGVGCSSLVRVRRGVHGADGADGVGLRASFRRALVSDQVRRQGQGTAPAVEHSRTLPTLSRVWCFTKTFYCLASCALHYLRLNIRCDPGGAVQPALSAIPCLVL